jgi:ribonuclease P protein component
MGIGRLVQSADFERALATPARERSPHFAIHHVDAGHLAPTSPEAEAKELSTRQVTSSEQPVDDMPGEGSPSRCAAVWLGMVVPKRHARRAVTRSLLKRAIRSSVAHREEALQPGVWVVRLRAPFARDDYPSAASAALRRAASDELDRMLARIARQGAGA